MATIKLGSTPLEVSVALSEGGDFVAEIDTADASSWGSGVTASLVFNDPSETTWTATRSGAALTWNVDKAAVAALIAVHPTRVRLIYADGTADMVWGRGPVFVNA